MGAVITEEDGTPTLPPVRGPATSHTDTFVIDRLPPVETWPVMNYRDLAVQYAPQLNCAAELIDAAVDELGFGERTLFHTSTGSSTYRDFLERSNQVANFLVTECGLEPGNRVHLHGPNTPMIAACWAGVVKAGGVCVATMPLLKEKELSFVVEKAQVHLSLTDQATSAEVLKTQRSSNTLTEVYIFGASGPDSLESKLARHSTVFENIATMATDPVIIAFTSGTTGNPKATVHFHRDVMAICDSFPHSILNLGPDDIITGTPPFAFTFGLGALLLFPMRYGASVALVEGSGPGKLLETIEKNRVTTCFTAPGAYRALLDHISGRAISRLRQCVSAGETLPPAVFDAWQQAHGIKIIDGIGATEMLHIFISAAGDDIRRGATGRPIQGYSAKIIDENGRDVEAGTVGLLAVRGPTGCRYLDDARQREYVRDGWNVTGDLYIKDSDGYFYFKGRADDLIISGGYNISPTEVEDALLTHAEVRECGVVGVPDGFGSQLVKAFVVLRNPEMAGAELVHDLLEHVREQMNPWKSPKVVQFVSELPKGSTAKLLRYRLREMG